ncbi:MAG: hypothetical protein Q4E07_00800 [Eubacteriales bacterium]|nr:hypothetical protein [Eubacteriales bacterium]
MTKRLLLLGLLSVAVLLLLSCMVVTQSETAFAQNNVQEKLFFKNPYPTYISLEQPQSLSPVFTVVCILYGIAFMAPLNRPMVDANGRVLSCKAYYLCAYEAFLMHESAG